MSKSPDSAGTRDMIVIGCSAGGVEALPRITAQLPANFGAAVVIVQHLAPATRHYLPEILQRTTALPVRWAEQGERCLPGRIYIAPADAHLLFNAEHLQLARTARENHSRPSIDRLFRSAAATHGSRVVGVLLTGMLDDGVAGLLAIREAKGTVIVQDPDEAAFPDLPRNALAALAPDYVLPLDSIGMRLVLLANERAHLATVPELVMLEAELDRTDRAEPEQLDQLGPRSVVSCPDCNGPTWQLAMPHGEPRFRCYMGHVNTARELLESNRLQLESALWSAVRALNDRAATLQTLATEAEHAGRSQISQEFWTRARDARQQADVAHKFMLELTRPR